MARKKNVVTTASNGKIVNVRLSVDMYGEIEKIARKEDRPISNMIRQMITFSIDNMRTGQ